MSINAEGLEAELRAINLWDRLFAESEQPDMIAKDACTARFFRRVQVIVQLQWLTARREDTALPPGGKKKSVMSAR
jgi:hypothetical protein